MIDRLTDKVNYKANIYWKFLGADLTHIGPPPSENNIKPPEPIDIFSKKHKLVNTAVTDIVSFRELNNLLSGSFCGCRGVQP